MTAKTLAQHDELMKKTETMNVLMETNKMLREEKERLEQDLQQTQAKVLGDCRGREIYCTRLGLRVPTMEIWFMHPSLWRTL